MALYFVTLAGTFGCDKPRSLAEPEYSDAVVDAGSKAVPSNDYSRQLFAMHTQTRRAVFRNLMNGSDHQCDLVSEAVLRGGHDGVDLWRVACTDSGDWMISIEPDSSTRVLSCAVVAKLGDDCHAIWRGGPKEKHS